MLNNPNLNFDERVYLNPFGGRVVSIRWFNILPWSDSHSSDLNGLACMPDNYNLKTLEYIDTEGHCPGSLAILRFSKFPYPFPSFAGHFEMLQIFQCNWMSRILSYPPPPFRLNTEWSMSLYCNIINKCDMELVSYPLNGTRIDKIRR